MEQKVRDRIVILREMIDRNMSVIVHNEYEGGCLDGQNSAAEDEIEFLESLLLHKED
jgi:hypothetical protein